MPELTLSLPQYRLWHYSWTGAILVYCAEFNCCADPRGDGFSNGDAHETQRFADPSRYRNLDPEPVTPLSTRHLAHVRPIAYSFNVRSKVLL